MFCTYDHRVSKYFRSRNFLFRDDVADEVIFIVTVWCVAVSRHCTFWILRLSSYFMHALFAHLTIASITCKLRQSRQRGSLGAHDAPSYDLFSKTSTTLTRYTVNPQAC